MQNQDLNKKLGKIDAEISGELETFYSYATCELYQIDKDQCNKLNGVLEILLTVSRDDEVLLAAIALPLYLKNIISEEEAKEKFTENVRNLLSGVKQLGFVHEISLSSTANQDRQQESLRKMLLSMSKDIRVVFIKLAEQLYVMRNLKQLTAEVGDYIALETRNIFAPLANRLGIWIIKWELEDLAFRQLNPVEYKNLARRLDEKRAERESYIRLIKDRLGAELDKINVKHELSGRSKHIYSIWRKMQQKQKKFDELYDLRALRVLTDTEANCYQVLGVVHNLWKPIPKEFDDYISNPKSNNYQSLHTAVRAVDNKVIEVQIRTFEMHEFAESGVAAHWRYKEKTSYDPGFESKVKWLRQLMNWQDDIKEQEGSLESFADKLAEEQIYIFTPAGEVMELPTGSTPLDFAYAIHTELGHRTRGAKIDNKIVPLTYKLETAQSVEILTTKDGKPARDWMMSSLGYLHTAGARAKVKNWFRKNDFEENIQNGRSILFKEARRLRVSVNITFLLARFNCKTEDEMLVKIALGEISPGKLAAAFQAVEQEQQKVLDFAEKAPHESSTSGFVIEGVGQLLTTIATCCNPLPGDNIVGFITKGRGVSIHHADCQNALHLNKTENDRMLDVRWAEQNFDAYKVEVMVYAHDRADILKDITTLLANEKITITSLNSNIDPTDNINSIRLGLTIQDLQQLSKVTRKLEQFRNVISASRVLF